MDLELAGKRAVVFGASQGIGLAVATSLVKEGAKVMLSSRSKENLKQAMAVTKAECYVCCDTTVCGSAKKALEFAMEKWQGIDIVVLNTGGPEKGAFLKIDQGQWERDYQSLWLSVTESLQTCLPPMQAQGLGRIILISSIAAIRPLSKLTTSNALRAGLRGLFESVAAEVARDGVSLNIILPGYTATERLKALNLSAEKIEQMVPAGRLAMPDEIGALAAYLASPLARYITGQSIAIDGGASVI